MADETTTSLNQGLDKWLQVTTAGDLQTWDGTDKNDVVKGVSMADQWRLTTDFTGTSDPIASNLERVDTHGFEHIGSGMSEASGIFTFPVTGYYLIDAVGYWGIDGEARSLQMRINVTTDNSTYNFAGIGSTNIADVGTGEVVGSARTSIILKVTDVSLIKVSFSSNITNSSVTTRGDTGFNLTHFTFLRLGDI